ncbi:protease complex subunit PrcB family protein [Deinococcus piscis]|nr:protease complex subunit PrcB family protein [Deinococcus piscis]
MNPKISLMALKLGILGGAGILSGCAATAPAGLAVHEALLYGAGNQRLTWVYGDLAAGQSSQVSLGGQSVQLAQVAGAADGALTVNGNRFYQSGLSGSVTQPKVTRTAQGLFDVASAGGISELYYTDGRNWYLLSATAGAAITAQPVSGLEGAGELTPSEAASLTRSLSGQGALAVGVLASSSVPDQPLAVTPEPQERRLTALSVARVTAATSGTGAATPATPAPTPGGTMNYSVLDKGNNAAASGPTVQVATTAAQAEALYGLAYGRQSSRPSAPSLNGKTLVGIFMGTRSTGGYSLEVQAVDVAGGRVTVQVLEKAPAADMLTTQALTSPWVIVELQGRYSDVQVQGLGRSAGVGTAEQ